MIEKNCILTISILASNSPDNVRRCLDSLVGLRNCVSSELIIVDTSENPTLHKILCEYTDNVIPFHWINDFSAARNKGLFASNGEWFLFLDDDEWFVDTTELEFFFNSGEYKDYGYADYLVRSFSTPEHTRYSDCRLTRAFRITENLRFISAIHEYCKLEGVGKFLIKTIANHSGYAFHNYEQIFAKVMRNTALLQKNVESEPDVPQWYIYLAYEYYGIKDYKSAADTLKKALENVTAIFASVYNQYRGAIYCGLIENLLKLEDLEEAARYYEIAAKDESLTPMSELTICYHGAMLCYKSFDYATSRELCSRFAELKSSIEKRPGAIYESIQFINRVIEDDEIFRIREINAIDNIRLGNLKEAVLIIEGLLSEGTPLSEDIDLITAMLDTALSDTISDESPDWKFISSIISLVLERDDLRTTAIELINERENDSNFRNISKILYSLKKSYLFINLMKLKALFETVDIESLHKAQTRLVVYKNSDCSFESSCGSTGSNQTIDNAAPIIQSFSQFIFDISIDNWEKCVDKIIYDEHYIGLANKISLVFDSITQDDSPFRLYALYYNMKMKERSLTENTYQSYNECESALRDFACRCISYYEYFYSEVCFNNSLPHLPFLGKAAVKLSQALKLLREGNIKSGGELLKEAIECNPRLSAAIKSLTDLLAVKHLGSSSESSESGSTAATNEMDALGRQIKDKIKLLIKGGYKDEAGALLMQFKAITPLDTEISDLENML